ncbi:unnamed protein product [Rhizoctonia solani]|uniref:Uncharacterized protein n=1 Tax=Rhizoctonia solani TaxID=456999 RepID=A0A8H3E3W5_9AGAM|nr:unnamed protein product [Rhizoctonia solani]
MLGHHHQTQGASPMSAPEVSAQDQEQHSPPQGLLSCILRWYDGDAPGLLHLRNVDYQEFGNTLNKLWKEGIKIRFDWDQNSGTVTIRSPLTFYEKVGVWVALVVKDAINKKLEQVAICGRPFVVPGGSSEVMVGHSPQVAMEYRSRVQPDQSLYLLQADEVEEEPSPPQSLLSCILRWYDEGAPGLLHLRNVDFNGFGSTFEGLRFDWDQSTGTVTVRSPPTLYEIVGGWFSRTPVDAINEKLAQVAICGRPSVEPRGSPGVMVGHSPQVAMEYRSRVKPDQSLYLLQVDEDGELVEVQRTAPRIVLETSGTESRQYAIEKAFKYLYETDGAVQAVIICHMTDMSSSTPKPFKAEMAVLRRKETGDVDKDSPLEQCYHHGALDNHPTSHGFTGDSDYGTNTNTESNTACLVSDNSENGAKFDALAREYSRIDPNTHQEQRICCGSPGWIVVYDEDGPEPLEDPTIELDVYDILRACCQRPNDYIMDRRITVPLGRLRRSLFLEVQAIRDPPTITAPTTDIAPVHPDQELPVD